MFVSGARRGTLCLEKERQGFLLNYLNHENGRLHGSVKYPSPLTAREQV